MSKNVKLNHNVCFKFIYDCNAKMFLLFVFVAGLCLHLYGTIQPARGARCIILKF